MPSSTSRRRFLQVAVAGGVAGLGGCLGSVTSRWDPSPQSAGTGTPTARTLEPPEGNRTDDIYVKNDDRDVERVSIRLVRTDAGENWTVLDNDYRFPSATQMVIPDVGEQGATYELVVSLDGQEAARETWDVDTCEGTEAPKGNRDLEVQIEDGEAEVVTNACDAIWVESRNPFDHTEFLVEGTGTETADD